MSFMPHVNLNPKYMEDYTKGRSVYLGPTTPINYGVMSTRVDPDTGQIDLTGYREERGVFPVLPGFFLSWIFKGIWNFLTGKLLSWLFKIKPEENPLRLDFHYGYVEKEYAPSKYGGNGNGYGKAPNGNGMAYNGNGHSWENGLARQLYPLD